MMTSDTAKLATTIKWRLVYPCILFMFLSSLDRANISFAALQMNEALGMTPSQYGFGAGILFVGFLAGQFPSVLFFQRFGMRRWIFACTLMWGGAATSMAFIQNAESFYVLRIVMGLAEGGLAPGIVLYLRQWTTENERASTFAAPMLAIPLSIILGGPISGWLMGMDNPVGLPGWRWMFIAEGVPTILLGIVGLFYFPDHPDDARWLSPDNRNWLKRNSAGLIERGRKQDYDWSAFRNPKVWLSSLLWFCLLSGAYGIMFWLPQLVDQMTSLSEFEIGLVNSVPWVGLALGIYFNARHSDRTGERFWHVAIPAALTGLSIVAASALGANMFGLAALFLAGLCLGGAQGAFWSVPTTVLTGNTITVAVVTINIFGSAGGLVTPHAVGWLREVTGVFDIPIYLIAAILFLAACLVMILKGGMRRSGLGAKTPAP